MAGAIKKISVQHGLDPRDFVLFCYGGGGPLHASALARELSIPTIIVPPEPGNFSAVGMLLADARLDLSETFTGLPQRGHDRRNEEHCSLRWRRRRAPRWSANSKRPKCSSNTMPKCAMSASVTTSRCRSPGSNDLAGIREAFDRDYQRRYGHSDARTKAEFQALHLSAFATLQRPELQRLPRAALRRGRAVARARSISARPAAWCDAQVYDRAALPIGFRGIGAGRDRGIRLHHRSWRPATASRSASCTKSASTAARRKTAHEAVYRRTDRHHACGRSDHARGDPPRAGVDHQPDRRQHQAHGVQRLHLRIQRFRRRAGWRRRVSWWRSAPAACRPSSPILSAWRCATDCRSTDATGCITAMLCSAITRRCKASISTIR